ncbi:MAG: ABC transporter substrate-binding protein [Corynebacterium sp.]|nr:ABC transporter substrate-binding protein [Corynebacterium sp.]
MDRRQFLKTAALGAAGSALVGCGTELTNTGNLLKPVPSKAGLLRIAALGNAADDIDPAKASTPATWTAIYAIFESLAITGPDGPLLHLAKRVESNDEATVWTVMLRDNATFSDDSKVTAHDVIESLKYLQNVEATKGLLECLDLAKSKVFDETTAVLPLTEPRFDFVESVLAVMSPVFKHGDPSLKVGSGPYVLDSGSAQDGWKLKSNQHYPASRRLSNGLEITPIDAAEQRILALNAGEIDLALDLPVTADKQLNNEAETWSGGRGDSRNLGFVLNVKTSPFDQEDARRAMKLAIDREKLADVILEGKGQSGNDAPGQALANFPSGLRVKRDVDQAKKLFASAGVTDMTVVTSELSPGMNDAAFLLVDQLKEAGVKVKVEEREPATYLEDFRAFDGASCAAICLPNFALEHALPIYAGSESVFNLSGWEGDETWKADMEEYVTQGDSRQREELIHELGAAFSETGPLIIWGVRDAIHGRAKGSPDVTMHLGVPIMSAVG